MLGTCLDTSERIEVHNKGRVFGALLTPTLVVEEGAYLEATCQTKGGRRGAVAPGKEPGQALSRPLPRPSGGGPAAFSA